LVRGFRICPQIIYYGSLHQQSVTLSDDVFYRQIDNTWCAYGRTSSIQGESGVTYLKSIDIGFYFSIWLIIRRMLDWLLYFIKLSFLYRTEVLSGLCRYQFYCAFRILSRDVCHITCGDCWFCIFGKQISICIALYWRVNHEEST